VSVDGDRLATELWVAAYMRRATVHGDPVVLARRGDATRGAVLLKLNRFERGWQVLSQARDPAGRLGWIAGAAAAEAEADAYIARALARDPDLWVLEVEDRAVRHPLDGKLL